MKRDPRPAITDMLNRIERLRRFDPDAVLVASPLSDERAIVERCLEVISEASRSLSDVSKARYPDIDWRGIADIGNVLRHAYDRVAPRVIADILRNDLDVLQHAVTEMLAELDRG
ncbi:HepT-like ribonuclease domain-containing protein [Brevundimonas sp.]|uniref:HepT-like ribonuclease domain-containing protein n=1 Tax=Brevundimonas sp. TaxID=1871086 RepID=UPI001A2D09FE|nr:HepT-like ribonuclease domain-containing protein [Brevundimonas sp.]MBJ7486645.1 DUF86 domain-containing protein [Brevundimonas sp.]